MHFPHSISDGTFRINAIKRYFETKHYKLLDITPKILDTYFRYCLQYGKVNQKTKELEPLSVRSVRDYRNILYSVFAQAKIDGILKVNPVNDVHRRKNKEYSEEYYFMTEDEISELLHFMIQNEQLQNKAFFQSDYQNHDGYVFTWEDGRAYNPDYISKLFKKAMKSFGRPEITLYNLRHSCASMLINKGWDIKKLQYWLGHTDAQTTLNIYSHFIRQRLNASDNDLSQISLDAADLFA